MNYFIDSVAFGRKLQGQIYYPISKLSMKWSSKVYVGQINLFTIYLSFCEMSRLQKKFNYSDLLRQTAVPPLIDLNTLRTLSYNPDQKCDFLPELFFDSFWLNKF